MMLSLLVLILAAAACANGSSSTRGSSSSSSSSWGGSLRASVKTYREVMSVMDVVVSGNNLNDGSVLSLEALQEKRARDENWNPIHLFDAATLATLSIDASHARVLYPGVDIEPTFPEPLHWKPPSASASEEERKLASTSPVIFSATNAVQTYTVDSSTTVLWIKMWGAGGGGT